MKILNEFKTFALKGNVLDMAIGVIIGAAFSKIVSSLVKDILTPIFGLLTNGSDLKDKFFEFTITSLGKESTLKITYGLFLQNIIDFIIIAFSIFMFVKLINNLKRKEEEVKKEPAPPVKSEQEILLTEIRDLLKKN